MYACTPHVHLQSAANITSGISGTAHSSGQAATAVLADLAGSMLRHAAGRCCTLLRPLAPLIHACMSPLLKSCSSVNEALCLLVLSSGAFGSKVPLPRGSLSGASATAAAGAAGAPGSSGAAPGSSTFGPSSPTAPAMGGLTAAFAAVQARARGSSREKLAGSSPTKRAGDGPAGAASNLAPAGSLTLGSLPRGLSGLGASNSMQRAGSGVELMAHAGPGTKQRSALHAAVAAAAASGAGGGVPQSPSATFANWKLMERMKQVQQGGAGSGGRGALSLGISIPGGAPGIRSSNSNPALVQMMSSSQGASILGRSQPANSAGPHGPSVLSMSPKGDSLV